MRATATPFRLRPRLRLRPRPRLPTSTLRACGNWILGIVLPCTYSAVLGSRGNRSLLDGVFLYLSK